MVWPLQIGLLAIASQRGLAILEHRPQAGVESEYQETLFAQLEVDYRIAHRRVDLLFRVLMPETAKASPGGTQQVHPHAVRSICSS